LNVLNYYKDRDDDAKIAVLAIEEHGWPEGVSFDIRKAWGINKFLRSPKSLRNLYFPSTIKPNESTMKKLFKSLTSKKVFVFENIPEVTWENFDLPIGIYNVRGNTHCYGSSEVAYNLVSKIDMVVGKDELGGVNTLSFVIPDGIVFPDKNLIKKWMMGYHSLRKTGVNVRTGDESYIKIGLPNVGQGEVNKEKCSQIRQLLLEHDEFMIRAGDKMKELLPMKILKKGLMVERVLGKKIEEIYGGQ